MFFVSFCGGSYVQVVFLALLDFSSFLFVSLRADDGILIKYSFLCKVLFLFL
jgi:hypothetical protein